jgi:N-acetylmuramoyl-L-alanine amidase
MTKKPVVVLDAGHGGHDSGAVGPRGLRESDVALAVVMLMGALLAPVATVVYTRKTDVFIELGERARIANKLVADALVSIHCNSGESGKGAGFEVFTFPGPSESDFLATEMFSAYGEQFPHMRKRMDLSDGDPDKEERFAVLRKTQGAAVLFELEFIHTTTGEDWLGNKVNQSLAAKALVLGIKRHFQIK